MSQQPPVTSQPRPPRISNEEEERLRLAHTMDILPRQFGPDWLHDRRATDQHPAHNEEAEALRRVVRFLLEYYRSKSLDTTQPTQEGHRESCPKSD
jgi:hypothetical protein